jgi:hypothetical protein
MTSKAWVCKHSYPKRQNMSKREYQETNIFTITRIDTPKLQAPPGLYGVIPFTY